MYVRCISLFPVQHIFYPTPIPSLMQKSFACLFLLALLTSCDLGGGSTLLDAFEQNYRQTVIVNASLKEVNATLSDNINATFQDVVYSEPPINLVEKHFEAFSESALLTLLQEIAQHKSQLFALAEYDETKASFNNKEEEWQTSKYWADGGLNDLRSAYRYFEEKLTDIATKINGEAPTPLPEDYWKQFEERRPVISFIATVEGLETHVMNVERQFLRAFMVEMDPTLFRIDKYTPVVVPESRIVTAGLQFQARLFLMPSSSQFPGTFSGNGVETAPSGEYAELTLPASGVVIPKGKNEGYQRYSANIEMKTLSGTVENYPIEGTFTVRKPEILITSPAVQNLYRTCGNAVNIDVPALGDYYNPKVNVSSGSILQSKESIKKWMIIPEGRQCNVTVSSVTNGQSVNIGAVKYKVIEPPKPNIEVLVNGRVYDGSTPIPKTSRVLVRIKPDEEFRAALPNDARYGISTVDILLQDDGSSPPRKVETTEGGRAEQGIKIKLPPEVRNAPGSVKVYLRVDEVYRLNYRNQRKPDKRFSEMERTLGVAVR